MVASSWSFAWTYRFEWLELGFHCRLAMQRCYVRKLLVTFTGEAITDGFSEACFYLRFYSQQAVAMIVDLGWLVYCAEI